MELSAEQVAAYNRDGFLIFPGLFSPQEALELKREAARVSEIDSDCVFREGESQQPKAMFRMHEPDGPTASAAYRAAAFSPRILRMAQQALSDDEVYIHHCKVNMKAAVEGTAWPWHQDFGSWHLDGIAKPDMTTVMVMLDEATEMNGCLYMLPGSHRDGRVNPYFDQSTAYKVWAVGPNEVKAYMQDSPPPVPLVGPPGTTAIFHCNLLHASGHNLSAQDRWQAYFCFNRVANRPADVENPRPDYVRSTNWKPMQVMPDAAIVAAE